MSQIIRRCSCYLSLLHDNTPTLNKSNVNQMRLFNAIVCVTVTVLRGLRTSVNWCIFHPETKKLFISISFLQNVLVVYSGTHTYNLLIFMTFYWWTFHFNCTTSDDFFLKLADPSLTQLQALDATLWGANIKFYFVFVNKETIIWLSTLWFLYIRLSSF